MNRFTTISLLFLLFQTYLQLAAQTSVVAVPYSVASKLPDIKEFENLSTVSREKMLKEDAATKTDRLKRHRFAKMIDVAFHPYNSGIWEETSEGRVWRLGIHSEGAYSLYEVFGKFRLTPGVKLFVYNKERTDFAGAFTSANNNRAEIFPIIPLPGESIIIELNVPTGTDDFGELILTKVGHDYMNEFGPSRLKYAIADPSGACNRDINCPDGLNWQTEKNAVCRLLSDGLLCTGTLINNAAGEKIPYLITASHCIADSMSAASSIFFFGYERPKCNVARNEIALSISGASLVSTTPRLLDFALLKLYQYPPASYNPYFAGWDVSGNTINGAACIHHPNGDVKKISIEKDPLTNADFGEGFDTLSHWLVSRWEVGTTEGGSSGAPLFNGLHRICGTLSGGDASCENSVNDYFMQLHRAWDDYPDSINQLKCWLDPLNSGKKIIDGVYPFGQQQNPDNVYSNTEGEYFNVYSNNFKYGTIGGQNSSGYTDFAEKFYAPSPIKLTGMYLRIADRFFDNIFSTFTIKVWDGQSKPSSEKYSQNEYYRSLIRATSNYFYFDSSVTVSDTFFVGYSVNYGVPDTLIPFTAVHRGANGTSTMYVYNGEWYNINEVTKPKINTALALGVISPSGINPALKVKRSLKIAPTYCTDFLNVWYSDDLLPISIDCYDVTGRRVPLQFRKIEIGLEVNTSILPSGVYQLLVQTKTRIWKGNFIVVRNE